MGRKKGNNKIRCLQCHHCKTRVFRSEKELKTWCGRQSIKAMACWCKEIRGLGEIRLIWCSQQRQLSSKGISPRNANPRYMEKMPEEEGLITITNQNKKPFIRGAKLCPYLSI